MNLSVSLLPFAGVPETDLNHLAKDLAARGVTVAVLKPEPIPADAYNPRRRQYLADDFLAVARRQAGEHVLGVTDCDLYAGNLNFVFGLAQHPGKAAVISLYRLRFHADAATFRARAVKEAVHELGHALGLGHCPNPACVMYFSNNLADTDRKGAEPCEACRLRLAGG